MAHPVMAPRESHDAPVFQKLKAARPRAGAASSRVIDSVLNDPQAVIHLSVTDLADLASTSEATVVRLFQGLGYRGYQDFKIQLSQSLVPGIRSLSAEIDPADKPHTVADKVFSTSAVTLSDTRAHVDPAQLEKAVALLAEAQRIEFIGCGGSSIVALDAQHKFFKLGIFCGASPDPHNAAQVCSLLGPGDVVVAISHSGATRDVLHAARIAVDAGAALIAITGLGRSPLSRLAEVTLHTSSPESRYRSEAVASRIAQLCLIDALVVAVHLRREPAASLNLARTRRALTQKRI